MMGKQSKLRKLAIVVLSLLPVIMLFTPVIVCLAQEYLWPMHISGIDEKGFTLYFTEGMIKKGRPAIYINYLVSDDKDPSDFRIYLSSF